MKVVSLFPELSSQSVDCSRCHELCGSDLNWFEPYPLTEVKDFRDWKYSSYEVILSPNGKPTVIKREEVMKWFGTSDNYLSLHTQWVTDAQAKCRRCRRRF